MVAVPQEVAGFQRAHDRRKLGADELLDALRAQGFTVKPGSTANAYAAFRPGRGGIVHFHSTSIGRDWNRAYDNLIGQLTRIGFVHPSDREVAVADEQTTDDAVVVNTKGFVRAQLSPPTMETFRAIENAAPDGLTNPELSKLTGFPVSTLRNHHITLRMFGLTQSEKKTGGRGVGNPASYRVLGPAIPLEQGRGSKAWRVDGSEYNPSSEYASYRQRTEKTVAAPTAEHSNGKAKPVKSRSGKVRTRKVVDETPAGLIMAALKVIERTDKEQKDALATIVANLGALVTEDAANRKRLRTIEDKLDALVGAL